MKPRTLPAILNVQLLSTATYRKVCQTGCFGAALIILVMSFWKMTQFELTEAQLFFAVLASLVVPFLAVIAGLMLPVSALARK